jgi:acyl homoserine lactone synthase
MIELIAQHHHREFAEAILDMHRLRCRVFRERLDWQVEIKDGMEIDEFDGLGPVYLLSRDGTLLQGCVRLLPSTGPTMLGKVFAHLLDGRPVPKGPDIWESSRFALDLPHAVERRDRGLAGATFELFAGMIEFGISRRLSEIVTVTDVRIERILHRAEWPLTRLGSAHTIGETLAVAGSLEVSLAALERLRQACHIRKRVLWAPVDFPPDLDACNGAQL